MTHCHITLCPGCSIQKKRTVPEHRKKTQQGQRFLRKFTQDLIIQRKEKDDGKDQQPSTKKKKKKQPTHKLIKQDDQNLQQPSGAAQPTAGDAPTSNKSLDVGKSNDDTDLE